MRKIGVHFSNSLEVLAHWLEQNFNCADPFHPPLIIVPNQNLKVWLSNWFNLRHGVAMHYSFAFLEEGLASLMRGSDKIRLLDQSLAQDLLLPLLCQPTENLPARLGAFLRQEPRQKSLKTWQLCQSLAHLFLEYEFHRPEMLACWQKNQPFPFQDPQAMAMEEAQRALYQMFLAEQRKAEEFFGLEILTLNQLSMRPIKSHTTPAIHCFGLSQVSALHYEILGRVSEILPVHVYGFNPCLEFWEDLETSFETRRRLKKAKRLRPGKEEELKGLITFDPQDHPLLRAFGRAGRENIRLLCGLCDYSFEEEYVVPQITTLLQALQISLLHRSLEIPPMEADSSIQIQYAPSKQREVEAALEAIGHAMRDIEGLKLEECAILVPDMQTYRPLLLEVFSRQASPAFHLIDSSALVDSIYGSTFQTLLKTLEQNPERLGLFELLSREPLRRRFEYTLEDLREWSLICEHAGFFEGLVEGEGEYNFSSCLKKLIDQNLTSPAPLLSENFASLVQIVETLIFYRQKLKQQKSGAPISWWQEFLLGLCQSMLLPPESGAEGRVAQEVQKVISELENLVRNNDFVVDLSLIQALFSTRLSGLASGVGHYLGGGVCLAGLFPLRPIPFRLVVILGLEEGSFFARTNQFSLDLRRYQRKIGDISPKERNEYILLEVLSSVKDRLVLSYVDRDLQKDQYLSPSSALLRIQECIRHLLKPQAASGPRKIPLRALNLAHQPAIQKITKPLFSGQIEHPVDINDLSLYLANPLLGLARQKLFLKKDRPEYYLSESLTPLQLEFLKRRELLREALCLKPALLNRDGLRSFYLDRVGIQLFGGPGAFCLYDAENFAIDVLGRVEIIKSRMQGVYPDFEPMYLQGKLYEGAFGAVACQKSSPVFLVVSDRAEAHKSKHSFELLEASLFVSACLSEQEDQNPARILVSYAKDCLYFGIADKLLLPQALNQMIFTINQKTSPWLPLRDILGDRDHFQNVWGNFLAAKEEQDRVEFNQGLREILEDLPVEARLLGVEIPEDLFSLIGQWGGQFLLPLTEIES